VQPTIIADRAKPYSEACSLAKMNAPWPDAAVGHIAGRIAARLRPQSGYIAVAGLAIACYSTLLHMKHYAG
jgi:hypothetical protein